MPYPPELLAARRAILRTGLPITAGTGLEIAPLAWPTVGKDEGRIRYIDHFDTDALRRRYAGNPDVPVDRIAPVDALWGAQTLDQCLDGARVDYIIASHVAEHVPDLLTWLGECETVLAPGGELRLVLPDRRVSSDALRRETDIADILAAFVQRARRPQVREVLDFFLYDAPEVDRGVLYAEGLGAAAPRPRCNMWQAVSFAMQVRDTPDHYEDVHCWAFAPRGFARMMLALAENAMTRLACADFTDSAPPWFEFFVFLRPTDDRAALVASWRRMAEQARDPLPGSAEARAAERIAAMERALQDARARIAAMENSLSWRATKPLRALRRR